MSVEHSEIQGSSFGVPAVWTTTVLGFAARMEDTSAFVWPGSLRDDVSTSETWRADGRT